MIYLDHAATSWPKAPQVAEAVAGALADFFPNAGRSGYQASADTARRVYQARAAAAALLGGVNPQDIAFTRGATEGLNLVLRGFVQPGQRVGVSPLEHNAVMRPLASLARQRHVTIETLPADAFGRLDLAAVERRCRQEPFDLIVVAHASNVNGVVQDLAGLRSVVGETPILVDAAQTAGVLDLDCVGNQLDFLATSAHKGLLAPTGLGLAYIAPRHDLPPLIEGGTGSQSESFEHPAFRPDRYEAGTLNLHGIVGLNAALATLPQRGLHGQHLRQMTSILLEQLSSVRGIRLHTPADGTALCLAMSLDGWWPEEVARKLEIDHDILCRPGLHCAPAAHRHLGTLSHGTLRLSPGWNSTADEMQAVVRAIEHIAASRSA